jgi:hypothetical protein
MIVGKTSHKLDLISKNERGGNTFEVGWNGVTPNGDNFLVTNIIYNPITITGISEIHYTIGEINYVTKYSPKTENGSILTEHPTTFSTNNTGYFFEFKGNDIKEEAKMGMVFEPKIYNNLFIERMNLAVFERHSRLAEVKTLTNLIEYRNGYYNIKEDI